MNYKKNVKSYICKDEDEMLKLGKEFASKLKKGDVVSLRGSLGSGKTVFVKGVAEGLKISDNITSPTFTLVQIYNNSQLQMNHLDLYRLNSEEDFYNIGGMDFLSPTGITLIEWTEIINEILPDNTYFINISILDNLSREVTISFKENE